MKQKKKPFLLMTIVVTLVVVLLGVNMSQYLRDPNRIKERKAPNAETVAKMKERQTKAAKPGEVQVGEMMQKTSMQTMGGGQVPLGEVPPKPSIELPRLQKYRSTYTTESTSAQWWKEKSKQKQTSDERAGVYEGSNTEG